MLSYLSAQLACAVFLATLPNTVSAAPLTIDTTRLATDIKVLSSDAFEGRAPATPGEEKTVGWIIGQMIAAGLQPGGEQRSGRRGWTQGVPLARFEIKGPVTARFTVGDETVPLAQGEQIAIRANMTGAEHVAIADAPVVFAGYGVRAPERRWDDFAGTDVKGKVVIVLVNDPDFESGTGDFGGKAMSYYGRWTYKYEEAARLGAAGLIVVHEDAPAAYSWVTVRNSNTIATFDIVRDDPTKAHVPLEAWMQRDVAVDLFRRAGLDFERLKQKASQPGFRAVELHGVGFSADFDVDHQVIVSKNVVGLLPGTSRPNDTLIYTAHWDHLGIGPPDSRGDTIYNGAADNATGVAALLELGRLFAAAPRTERSIVFMALTGEERGLLGSEYYATNPLYPLATTVADLNMDGVNFTGPARDFSSPGDGAVTLLDDLKAALKLQGRTYSADPRPEAGSFFRSDHFSFAKRGVPAISERGGEDKIDGGAAAGKAAIDAYIKDKYHQPADEWSDDWNLSGMAADVDLLYNLGRKLAQSTRWPAWLPGSEFKVIRDATAAARPDTGDQ